MVGVHLLVRSKFILLDYGFLEKFVRRQLPDGGLFFFIAGGSFCCPYHGPQPQASR